ncbi:MAG: hypothetical protein WKG06_16330 [Segetibacter sp.]
MTLITAVSILIFSCGPNDDKNSMDPENSNGEGAVDSTKIPNFDSTHASASSHASSSGPHFATPSINTNKINFTPSKKMVSFYSEHSKI